MKPSIPLKEKRASLDHDPKNYCPDVAFFSPINHGPNNHEESHLDHLIRQSIVPGPIRVKGPWSKPGFSGKQWSKSLKKLCQNDQGKALPGPWSRSTFDQFKPCSNAGIGPCIASPFRL
jgi:hypothetical protein